MNQWSTLRAFLAVSITCFSTLGCGGSGAEAPALATPTIVTEELTPAGLTHRNPALNLTVFVPAGAVDRNVEITSKRSETPVGSTIPVYGLTGTVGSVAGDAVDLSLSLPLPFSRPVEVTIPYDRTIAADPSSLNVAYWDESAAIWKVADTISVDESSGTVRFLTQHFSVWIPFLGFVGPTVLQSVDTGFRAATDGFDFGNHLPPPYSNPTLFWGLKVVPANCAGMSSTAIQYYLSGKNQNQPSLRALSQVASQPRMNEAIYRTSVSLNGFVTSILNLMGQFRASSVSSTAITKRLVATLQFTRMPLALTVQDDSRSNGHMVVLYRYEANADGSGTFFYYDPNLPGEEQQFRSNADGTIVPFEYAGIDGLLAGFLYASPYLAGGVDPSEVLQTAQSDFLIADGLPKQLSAIAEAFDDAGERIPRSGTTTDNQPTLHGTLSAQLAAGDSVRIYDGNEFLGAGSVSGLTWTFVPTQPLQAGTHNFVSVVTNSGGQEGVRSRSWLITVVAPVPTVPTINGIAPTAMTANGVAQSLTISGSGFATGNIVQLKRSTGSGAGVWSAVGNAISSLTETQIVVPIDPGTVADTVDVRVCRSANQTTTSDCSDGSFAIAVTPPVTAITTVPALKSSFARSECQPASGSGAFSALVTYRACGPAAVGDFEFSFGGCSIRKTGSSVTLSTTVGIANSISANLDKTYSNSNTFNGDSVQIGSPDPNYLAGSDESFHLFIGDFVGSTYLSIQLRTNGRNIVSLGAQDFLTSNVISCGN